MQIQPDPRRAAQAPPRHAADRAGDRAGLRGAVQCLFHDRAPAAADPGRQRRRRERPGRAAAERLSTPASRATSMRACLPACARFPACSRSAWSTAVPFGDHAEHGRHHAGSRPGKHFGGVVDFYVGRPRQLRGAGPDAGRGACAAAGRLPAAGHLRARRCARAGEPCAGRTPVAGCQIRWARNSGSAAPTSAWSAWWRTWCAPMRGEGGTGTHRVVGVRARAARAEPGGHLSAARRSGRSCRACCATRAAAVADASPPTWCSTRTAARRSATCAQRYFRGDRAMAGHAGRRDRRAAAGHRAGHRRAGQFLGAAAAPADRHPPRASAPPAATSCATSRPRTSSSSALGIVLGMVLALCAEPGADAVLRTAAPAAVLPAGRRAGAVGAGPAGGAGARAARRGGAAGGGDAVGVSGRGAAAADAVGANGTCELLEWSQGHVWLLP